MQKNLGSPTPGGALWSTVSLQNLLQTPRETQEPHRTKPQSWGKPSREAVWLVSPVSREDPLSEKGKSRALKLLALLCTHTHTSHPSGVSEGPSAEGQESSGPRLQRPMMQESKNHGTAPYPRLTASLTAPLALHWLPGTHSPTT